MVSRDIQATDLDKTEEIVRSLEPLMAAMIDLPPKYREVLFLRFIEAHSIAEIAILTGVPQGTVKSRLHHALCRLRKVVKSEPRQAGTPVTEKANEM